MKSTESENSNVFENGRGSAGHTRSTDYENWKARIAGHEQDYFLKRMLPIGITDKVNWFQRNAFKDSGHPYFEPNKKGGIDIYFPSGETLGLQEYGHKFRGDIEIRPIVRTRFKPGTEPWDPKTASHFKYKSPPGAGNPLFIGHNMLKRIRAEEEIPMVIITEGEIKTAVGDRLGLPVVGVCGIYNFSDTETTRLLAELMHMLKVCKTGRLCFLFDNDLFDLSPKVKPGEDPRSKPFSFKEQAGRFGKFVASEGLQAYIAWPNPAKRKVGLDDLIQDLCGDAPADLHRLESMEPLGNMQIHHWSDDCQTPYASSVCKSLGWDARYLFRAPDSDRKLTKKELKALRIGWHRLQPAISWLAHGRSIMRGLEKLVIGDGYKNKNFTCRRITNAKTGELEELWCLHDMKAFFDRYQEQLGGWESFMWGKKKVVIKDGVPEIEEQVVIIKLEDRGNTIVHHTQNGVKKISDFTMKGLWHISGDRDSISQENPEGEGYIFDFQAAERQVRALVSSNTIAGRQLFRARTLKLHLTWDGNQSELDAVVNRARIGVQTAPAVYCLGWQPEEKGWLWSNGFWKDGVFTPLDDMGFVTIGETSLFVPAGSQIYKNDDGLEATRCLKHGTDRGSATVGQWWRVASQVYKEGKAETLLAFVTASIFADFIREKMRGEFPILFLFGPPQMGKTTYATSILSFFGQPSPPLMLGNASTTIAGMQRTLKRFRNVPVHFDEVSSRTRPELMDGLKDAFGGTGGTQGSIATGNRTRGHKAAATVVASGQHFPDYDPATVTRCIFLEFSSGGTFGLEVKQKMDDLVAMQRHGLTSIIHDLLMHRALIESNWDMTFGRLLKSLFDKCAERGKNYDNRQMQSHVALITPLAILATHLRSVDGHMILDENYLVEMLFPLLELNKIASESASDAGNYFDCLQRAIDKSILRKFRHYVIDDGVLFLKPRPCHKVYKEMCKLQDEKPVSEATIGRYLKAHESFLEVKSTRLFGDGPIHTFAFDLKKLDFTEV